MNLNFRAFLLLMILVGSTGVISASKHDEVKKTQKSLAHRAESIGSSTCLMAALLCMKPVRDSYFEKWPHKILRPFFGNYVLPGSVVPGLHSATSLFFAVITPLLVYITVDSAIDYLSPQPDDDRSKSLGFLRGFARGAAHVAATALLTELLYKQTDLTSYITSLFYRYKGSVPGTQKLL